MRPPRRPQLSDSEGIRLKTVWIKRVAPALTLPGLHMMSWRKRIRQWRRRRSPLLVAGRLDHTGQFPQLRWKLPGIQPGAHLFQHASQPKLVTRPHGLFSLKMDLNHFLAVDGRPGFVSQAAENLATRDIDDVAGRGIRIFSI